MVKAVINNEENNNEENIELMRKLTDMNNKYVPKLYDDVNFYHSWIERQENTFVCKV